jgi:undecaprenyl-diphosphatase
LTAGSTHPSPPWTRYLRGELGRVAAVGAGALLFGVLLLLVRLQWVPLESVDHGVADGLNNTFADHPAAVAVWRLISVLGSYGILSWLVAIAAGLLAIRRRYRLAAYLVVAGVGAIILDPTLKHAVGRLRPVVPDPVAVGGGNSFPSGHSLGSIVVYGALLLVFAPALHGRARRLVIGAVAVLVVAIGVSRLALGVHFLSDVLGAWALGVAWLGITAFAFELHRREHGQRVTHPLAEGLEPEAAPDLRPAQPATPAEQARPAGPLAVSRYWAAAGLIVAWVLVFGALCAIGVPLARYRGGNGNVLGDGTIPHWLAAHRTALVNTWSHLGSEAGNTHMILAVGLVAGTVALAVVRRWRPVVYLLVMMFGELTLFLASAAIVDRARPDVPHLEGQLPTSSFPSGHLAATILLYAAIVTLAWPRTRAWWRWALVALAILMPLWVGLARLYYGMHHPTDLLGSIVLAAAWFTATTVLVRPNDDLRRGGDARRGGDGQGDQDVRRDDGVRRALLATHRAAPPRAR